MVFKVAVFSLNQWALDFTGNKDRIIKSIKQAHEAGAAIRTGPELEICGYSVEDGFYEQDTVYHSWSSLIEIIQATQDINMILDIGMPVYMSALYNCRVILYKGKILLIRAKSSLAREGNYREPRHFTPWPYEAGTVAFKLPSFVARETKQEFAPFGAHAILELGHLNGCGTIKIGWEICQELWDSQNVSARLYQRHGCHLVINGSGSYWELRKLEHVEHLVKSISMRGGATYAFSNLVGCDGQRVVFYGRSFICHKGDLVAMTPSKFDIFQEIQMVTFVINPRDIEEYRAQWAISTHKADANDLTWDLAKSIKSPIELDPRSRIFYLNAELPIAAANEPLKRIDHCLPFQQEIHIYVSLWLWDYLRRSKLSGFVIPLSGGLDSSSVATLVYGMCHHLYRNLNRSEVQSYFSSVHQIESEKLSIEFKSPKDICARLLLCVYLSTQYSSADTRNRAEILAFEIGAQFKQVSIQETYQNFRTKLIDKKNRPEEKDEVTLLDQNLQARLRMTATYYLSGGNRIVLATGNVDEAIMGYLTKYDCSSADLNPIGGLCKDDLRSYLRYCCDDLYKFSDGLASILDEIIAAPPSAELTGAEQRDEDEIGITYEEISVLGKVRRGIYGCNGPFGAFKVVWRNRQAPPFCDKIRCLRKRDKEDGQVALELSQLVRRFYQRYANNRHKLTILTPSLHAETYSPDDNRFDHRHFLYGPWTEQFNSIDKLVASIESGSSPYVD